MVGMTHEQMDQFLRGPFIARIGTLSADDEPCVTPVWYEWDGEAIYVIGRKRSSWVQHIKDHPQISVLIDDPGPPDFKIVIQGTGAIVNTDWVEIVRRMTHRYQGDNLGTKYFNDTLDQPRTVVKVTPKRITTWYIAPETSGGRGDWHPRYYEPGSKWHDEYQTEKKKLRSQDRHGSMK